jgi:hypothetical protein
VRRAGVDHLRGVLAQLVDQRHGLPGGIVGQAEHDEVDLAHHGEPGGRVLALLGGDAPDLEARNIGDAAPDLETGGAGLSVDEDGGLGLDRGLCPRLGLGGGLGADAAFVAVLVVMALFSGIVNKKPRSGRGRAKDKR